jgi:hypothetical protein
MIHWARDSINWTACVKLPLVLRNQDIVYNPHAFNIAWHWVSRLDLRTRIDNSTVQRTAGLECTTVPIRLSIIDVLQHARFQSCSYAGDRYRALGVLLDLEDSKFKQFDKPIMWRGFKV